MDPVTAELARRPQEKNLKDLREAIRRNVKQLQQAVHDEHQETIKFIGLCQTALDQIGRR